MPFRNSDQALLPRWTSPAILLVSFVVLAGTATPPGAAVVAAIQGFLSFYAGVCSLVALSVTVMVGVLATERTVLGIKHRVLAQGVHRATTLAGMSFLVAHIFVKVLASHASTADIILPRPNAVGMGTLASDLFFLVMITGMLRAWFAGGSRPWLWRVMHTIAYAAWPLSIAHGLIAGRAASAWVVWGYTLCLAAVGLAVTSRLLLSVRPGAKLHDDPAIDVLEGFTRQEDRYVVPDRNAARAARS